MEPKKLTRQDIANLLAKLGEPGENRDKKLQALKDLNKQNRQGLDLSLTIESYKEY